MNEFIAAAIRSRPYGAAELAAGGWLLPWRGPIRTRGHPS